MKLTKIIPARRKTVEFNWAYKYWMQCTQEYLAIRSKYRPNSKGSMTKCDWCNHKFEIGEWFGLAQPLPNQEGPRRNWALCHDCADLIGAPARRNSQSCTTSARPENVHENEKTAPEQEKLKAASGFEAENSYETGTK